MKILIRDGRGKNILRLKFSEIVFQFQQGTKIVRIGRQKDDISKKVGQVGSILIGKIRYITSKELLVTTRPKQIILDVCPPNKWSLEDESLIISTVEEFFRVRGKSVDWSVKREVWEQETPYFPS